MQEDGEGWWLWWLVLFTLNRNQKKMKGGGRRCSPLAGKTLGTCVISAGTQTCFNGQFSTCQYKDNEENNSILQMPTFNYSFDSFKH